MKRFSLLLLLLSSTTTAGQDASARNIYDQALAAKPKAEKLRFYDLDWAKDLSQAKERAQAEKRPIVFLWVTNITAGCDFFTGHT